MRREDALKLAQAAQGNHLVLNNPNIISTKNMTDEEFAKFR